MTASMAFQQTVWNWHIISNSMILWTQFEANIDKEDAGHWCIFSLSVKTFFWCGGAV